MQFLFGVFVVVHGLVHLLYLGQSARFFELKPGMVWPDGSWIFSSLVGDESTRNLASIALIIAAICLVASGIGIIMNLAAWRPLIVGAAVFSSVIYALLWTGTTQNLDGQGAVGIHIDVAILGVVLILRWFPAE